MSKKYWAFLFAMVLIAIGGLYFLGGRDIDRELAGNDVSAVTNTATNETNLAPSGADTNGLTVINDVGGKVSFQQSSSRTSAPVAPENPHLK